MRCPRCGDLMESGGDGWVCRRGAMELSKYLGQLLEAWVAHESPLGPGATALWGDSAWYCPADGSHMVDVAGSVGCPTCERLLPSRVMYMLIEHQVHLPVAREDQTGG